VNGNIAAYLSISSIGRLELRKDNMYVKHLCLTVMTANSGTVFGVVSDTSAVWDVLHRCANKHTLDYVILSALFRL
jgi:hypothetical protein